MQPVDGQAIARRALDVEDYIDILRRHKSWIFGPTFAALVIATVVAFLWPNTYVSTGMVRVVPAQIPDAYVLNNINNDLQMRFNSMLQGVLNKEHLKAIIAQYDLYKTELKRLPMEDVVENMRLKDIRINPVQSVGQQATGKAALPTFQIGFAYRDRHIAAYVAQKMISDLMTENTKQTQGVTSRTTEFLQTNRQHAKEKLDALESKLAEFQQRFRDVLPEQQQNNFNKLLAQQTQLTNLSSAVGRVNQDKLLMENQMTIWKEQMAQLKDPGPADPQLAPQKSEKLSEKDKEIEYYTATLAAARDRYKETHPDVQNLVAKLASAKKQREDIVKEEAAKKPELAAAKPVNKELVQKQQDLEAAIKRGQGMVEAKNIELADYQKQIASVTAGINQLNASMSNLPSGMKEYGSLVRDRDLAKKEYEDLDRKSSESEIATNVIRNNQGETLEQLELASVPETPTEPKRPLIIAAGVGIGIILGLFMAGAREVKDSSLKNLKDVRAYTQLPILGSIPLLENDLIVKRRRRIGFLAWSTACLIGVLVMTSSVVYYITTKS